MRKLNLLLTALLAVALVSFNSCSSSSDKDHTGNDILGEWNVSAKITADVKVTPESISKLVTEYAETEYSDDDSKMTLNFMKDNKFMGKDGEDVYRGTWAYEGNHKIVIKTTNLVQPRDTEEGEGEGNGEGEEVETEKPTELIITLTNVVLTGNTFTYTRDNLDELKEDIADEKSALWEFLVEKEVEDIETIQKEAKATKCLLNGTFSRKPEPKF